MGDIKIGIRRLLFLAKIWHIGVKQLFLWEQLEKKNQNIFSNYKDIRKLSWQPESKEPINQKEENFEVSW